MSTKAKPAAPLVRRVEREEQEFHAGAQLAKDRCCSILQGERYDVTRLVILSAIGDVLAGALMREKQAVSKAIAVIIGGVNPDQPGLVERIVRDRVRQDRAQQSGLLIGAPVSPLLGRLLQAVSGLEWVVAVQVLQNVLALAILGNLPPASWDREMGLLIGSATPNAGGQLEKIMREISRRRQN